MTMTCKNVSKDSKTESSWEETKNKNYDVRCSDNYSEILQPNTAALKCDQASSDIYARPSQPDIVNSHPPTPCYKDNHDYTNPYGDYREFKSEHNLVNHLQYDNYFNPFTQITVPVCTSSVKSISDYCTASPLYGNIDQAYGKERLRPLSKDSEDDLNESSPGTHV